MHPEIQAMDLNQLADLPVWAGRRRCDGPECRRPQDEHAIRPRRLAMVLSAVLSIGLVGAGGDVHAQAPERLAAFAMPANSGEWRPDIFGEKGAYRFRQVDGNCQITLGQNRGADAARAEGRNPRGGIDAYIARVAENVGRVERVNVDPIELTSDAGGTVAFTTSEFAYLGNDGVEYHNRISMAWVGDVELLIVAACPASEWLAGRVLLDQFIGKVSVSGYSDPDQDERP